MRSLVRTITAAILFNLFLVAPTATRPAELPAGGPRADVKSAVLAGIKIYLDQMKGTCFETSGEFSIGDYDKFAAAINKSLKDFVVGKAGAAWLKKNTSGNSSHFGPYLGPRLASATIYFPFDPQKKISTSGRQTMLHEMTHHIEC